MAHSLIYWPEAADDPAVTSILTETDPEDPDLVGEGDQEGGEDQTDEESDPLPPSSEGRSDAEEVLSNS
jgi:hypothetical protein